jgi:outer membrane lipoprotein-sorting protein
MKRLLTAIIALAFLSAAPVARADAGNDIVAAADKVRNPGEPFRQTVTLTEYINGKPRDQNVLTVFAKLDPATHQFRNLIRFDQPPRDAGKMVLLDRHSLWFYDPSTKASVRISPQQRLTGQASIAEVLNVNLATDYKVAVLGQETIQDADHVQRRCTHLDMHASNDVATYDRVEYWVEEGTNYPIKAKIYADSGRLLKTLYYRGFTPKLGVVRPSEAIIVDAVNGALVTTVAYGEFRFQEIPETFFQRENLPRLQTR